MMSGHSTRCGIWRKGLSKPGGTSSFHINTWKSCIRRVWQGYVQYARPHKWGLVLCPLQRLLMGNWPYSQLHVPDHRQNSMKEAYAEETGRALYVNMFKTSLASLDCKSCAKCRLKVFRISHSHFHLHRYRANQTPTKVIFTFQANRST